MYKVKYAKSVLTKDLPKLKSANLVEIFLKEVEKIKSNPFLGKQLVGPLKGKRSVRINIKHRIFYIIYTEEVCEKDTVYDGTVHILQAFGHDFL